MITTTTAIRTDEQTLGGGTMNGKRSAARALWATGGAPWATPRPAMILVLLATVLALLAGAVRPAEALVASPQFWITQDPNGPQFSADVSAKTVVWQDGRNGDADVYARNIGADDAEFPVATGTG